MTTVYKGRKNFRRSEFFMCSRKRQFVTEREALERAAQIKQGGGPAMHAYQCPHCNGWHLARNKNQ